MRIARIIEYFPPHIGGMERHGLILSQEQVKLGYSVDIFIGYGDKSGLTPTETRTKTDNNNHNELLYGDLTFKIRGAIFSVKKKLGLGHKEIIYQKALEEEFATIGINFEKEKIINIFYNNKKVGVYRPDFLIDNNIILELKSLPYIGRNEERQIWNYLKGSDYKLALLVNFGNKDIEIKRIIYDIARIPRESALSQQKSAIYKMPLQFLPIYSKARRFWFNFWAFRQVKKHHKKKSYDIIHLHGDFIEAYFGGKLSKKLGIPAVITIHAGLNKRLLKPKNAQYFKNISKIICVSEEIKDDLEKIGVPKEKITVISSGVYLVEFNSADESKISELRNQYSKPILISVGVLRISKGHVYLIDAYKQLKQKYASLSLIIIGDGPEKNSLERESKNLGDIYFLGRQNHDKIVEYLKVADIFVSSSIDLPQDREGTPTSIMEAMAAGLPVVATRVGGSPYWIKDGINGFLVNPGSAEELEKVIAKLIDNPDIVSKMQAQNLEDIKQKDWSHIVGHIEEIYKSVFK